MNETPNAPAKRLAVFHVMAKPVGPICNLDCKLKIWCKKLLLSPLRFQGIPLFRYCALGGDYQGRVAKSF
jgi:hypothetical protein